MSGNGSALGAVSVEIAELTQGFGPGVFPRPSLTHKLLDPALHVEGQLFVHVLDGALGPCHPADVSAWT